MLSPPMAKPEIYTALYAWARDNWLGDSEIAERLNALPEMEGRKPVNARQVARWRKGLAVPRPYYAKAITVLTDGKVTADHFNDAKLLTEAKGEESK